jgi:TolB-like protein
VASRLSLFLVELKRRKVYRVATVYLVVGAGIIGLCEAALPSDIWQGLQIPVGVIILIGLPVALVLAWAYELKPEEPGPVGQELRETRPPSGTPIPVSSVDSVSTAGTAEAEQRKSIAVLPFVDMSPDGDQEYFCDGMAEELINALTKVKDLRVAARTSSFYFKGRSEDVREIGRKLNVRTVLEGSVRRAENRLRVTAQLVSVGDGYHLWSESYDRELKDVFAIQDEISQSIVERLRPTLLGEITRPSSAEEGKLVVAPTRSMEAYDEYLLGRHYWENRYKEGLATALRHFQNAVELDPGFALPFTGVADSYTILGLFEYLRPEEARPRARAAAQRALELDDSLSDAHASMGLYQFWLAWDWERGALEFLRAIELNPEQGKAHLWLGLLRAEQGRFQEAFDEVGIAQSIDPLSSYVAALTACVYALAGDPATASEMLEPIVARDLARDPNVLLATFLLGWSYSLMSRRDLAVAMGEKAVALSNDAGHFKGALGMWYGQAGMRQKARVVLEELRSRQGSRHVSPLWLLWIHLGLGEKEESTELFARVISERCPYAHPVPQDLQWRPLWSDSRFIELGNKVGSGVVSRAWERVNADGAAR